MSSERVAAVIVNWNNYEDTSSCIHELKELSHEDINIIVVDNHSTDKSGVRIQSEFKEVQVIFNDENHGFAGGNNIGIQEALDLEADYVWILNNDVTIPNDRFLKNILQTFHDYTDAGIVSPRIQHYPETDEVWFEQGRINWSTGHAYHVNKSNWFVDWEVARCTEQADARRNNVRSNDYVPFCSAIIEAEVFEEVGLLPEQYFLYKEDADFCTQAIDQGYDILTARTVELYHYVSQSTGGTTSPVHSYYTSRSIWLFRGAYQDRINIWIFALWYFMWLTTRIVYNLFKGNLESILASLRGTVDGITQKRGKGPYP